jgi:signal transduction histidine kinase
MLLWSAPASLTLLLVSSVLAVRIGAPRHDSILLGFVLGVTGLGSLVFALVLLRAAEVSPHFGLRLRLLVPGVLAIVVMLVNIWLAASMMFISHHDLVLLGLLLAYACALAMVATFALATSITWGLRRLTVAVRSMADGGTGVRVRVTTADEIGALGDAFNRMVEQVEAAARQRRDMDEARRGLFAAVSHDLRTPLAAVRAMLEAIEDGVVDDPQTIARYHRTMLAEVDRLSRLIDDLFELTRIEAGALTPARQRIDLADLLGETVEAMQAEAGRAGVTLAAHLDPELPPIEADPQMIHRVVLNLLTNALRHTPCGGRVLVSAYSVGASVAVEVADTGEGIGPEHLPHVFERFYRGDRSRSRAGGGTGLGLAIARGLVEMHGGTIGVESTLNEGSTFRFTLPVSP